MTPCSWPQHAYTIFEILVPAVGVVLAILSLYATHSPTWSFARDIMRCPTGDGRHHRKQLIWWTFIACLVAIFAVAGMVLVIWFWIASWECSNDRSFIHRPRLAWPWTAGIYLAALGGAVDALRSHIEDLREL